MATWRLPLVAFVATLALLAGASAASANEPPLAEAGLDQTVDNGTTVYLDAGGSTDPDGTVAAVKWTVTDPDGAPVTTDDDASIRTSFTPTQTGNYTANLSVTDDAGATREDTLYVTVEEPDGPTVTLAGPDQTTRGESTEFTVSSAAGDADLRQLYWIENGSSDRSFDLSGDEATMTVNRSFDETGTYQLDATVLDAKGYSRTSSLQIRVSASGGGGGNYDHCPGDGSPYFDADGDFVGCNDGGADMVYEDRVLEANGESGLDLYSQDAGEVEQMVTEEQVDRLQESNNSPLTRKTVKENYKENHQINYGGEVSDNAPNRHSNSGSSSSKSGSSTTSSDSGTSGVPYPPLSLTTSPSFLHQGYDV
jgi:hypothetical protein